MSGNLFSYVVRYDSGFAPNPFYGYCTLATCKPGIRQHAKVGDWLVGTASNGAHIRRGGYLVYAMRVTEILTTSQYWQDPRFQSKKPNLTHNWVTASGDNIYEPIGPSSWRQLNSYHSEPDGKPVARHISRDTSVEKILVSDDYLYFGGEGPKLPAQFLRGGFEELCHSGQSYRRVRNEKVISSFVAWLRSLGSQGYQGKPWDWVQRAR